MAGESVADRPPSDRVRPAFIERRVDPAGQPFEPRGVGRVGRAVSIEESWKPVEQIVLVIECCLEESQRALDERVVAGGAAVERGQRCEESVLVMVEPDLSKGRCDVAIADQQSRDPQELAGLVERQEIGCIPGRRSPLVEWRELLAFEGLRDGRRAVARSRPAWRVAGGSIERVTGQPAQKVLLRVNLCLSRPRR